MLHKEKTRDSFYEMVDLPDSSKMKVTFLRRIANGKMVRDQARLPRELLQELDVPQAEFYPTHIKQCQSLLAVVAMTDTACCSSND